MAAERINAETVAAENLRIDAEDRLVAGNQVIAQTAVDWALRDLAPREWEEIAAYLFALIAREPLKTSPAYAGHRILFGTLATELRSFAASAGEPVGLEADLRAATTQAEERRIRELIADQRAYADRLHDEDLVATLIRGHDPAPDDEPGELPTEEEIATVTEPPAAPSEQADDDLAFL